MASLPSDLSDLHPQTTREWFMFLNTKIDTILESQAEDRDTLIDYMQKTNDWIKCHDNGLVQREKLAERHDEKIKELERKVNGWNILNSIGVVIAAILAALGLKGS
jgi:hypothetical protein